MTLPSLLLALTMSYPAYAGVTTEELVQVVHSGTCENGTQIDIQSLKETGKHYRTVRGYSLGEEFTFVAFDDRKLLQRRFPYKNLAAIVTDSNTGDSAYFFDSGANGTLDIYCVSDATTNESICSSEINPRIQATYGKAILKGALFFSKEEEDTRAYVEGKD